MIEGDVDDRAVNPDDPDQHGLASIAAAPLD